MFIMTSIVYLLSYEIKWLKMKIKIVMKNEDDKIIINIK